MKFDFDAELTDSNGVMVPVYCEVQPPCVGGQKALIKISLPSQQIVKKSLINLGKLSGKCGEFHITMKGVNWSFFPTSSKNKLGLETIKLLHVDRLEIRHPSVNAPENFYFHFAPISYLRTDLKFTLFSDRSSTHELFSLNLPELGETKFVVNWLTIYYQDAEIPSGTVIAGFSAIADLPKVSSFDVEKIVENFRNSLEVLSVLFRQAVTLHGWTYTNGAQKISTWVDPLEPNVTPSAREERGEFVAVPKDFVEYATKLAQAYGKADAKNKSLVRHLLLAVNPYSNLRANDHFIFMFSALERVIEAAWKVDTNPHSPAVTDNQLISLLEGLKESVMAEGGENASLISERIQGLIGTVNRPGVGDKFKAFLRVYPSMNFYCEDLWPFMGNKKKRGLREVRHSLAHGSGSFVSADVVAVAKWHLGIMLERLIFVLLGMQIPDGIRPNSYLLNNGGKGWYGGDWWTPLQSKLDQKI